MSTTTRLYSLRSQPSLMGTKTLILKFEIWNHLIQYQSLRMNAAPSKATTEIITLKPGKPFSSSS